MKWEATFYTQMVTLQIEAEDGNEAMRKAVESPECTRALEQFKINHPDAPLFHFDFGKPGPSMQILVQPTAKPPARPSIWRRQLRAWWGIRVASAQMKCPHIWRWFSRWH